MALTDIQRQEITRKWIRRMFVDELATASLNYADIKAAIDAFDDALDATTSSLNFVGTSTLLANLNNILTLPFRTTATNAQKAVLLSYVLLKRGGII